MKLVRTNGLVMATMVIFGSILLLPSGNIQGVFDLDPFYQFSIEGEACGNSPGLRHVYRADKLTFDEAKASCQQMGARLAVANTEAEALLLGNLARYDSFSFLFTF
jgi:hypothetical protein